MPRRLEKQDIEILKILAPELEELICEGSGHEFHSILPPVSNHIAKDEEDFLERIRRLSRDDLEYLAQHILDGTESLGCMPPEDVENLAQIIEDQLSPEIALMVRRIYAMGESCDV